MTLSPLSDQSCTEQHTTESDASFKTFREVINLEGQAISICIPATTCRKTKGLPSWSIQPTIKSNNEIYELGLFSDKPIRSLDPEVSTESISS
jgi:hypothetical protein